MTMRNTTLLCSVLALVLAGCGGGANDTKDAKGKTTTAKKDAKDAKAKKDDKKADDKKADDKKADDKAVPTTAGEEPAGDDKAAENELTDEKVVEVAKVAKEIEAKPADADAILQQHGMDREQFDVALATIAKDQWKSDIYIAAFSEPAKG